MKVMRDKHISKEMHKNRKSMQNDYVKKMALQINEETLIGFDEHEYTPMNQNFVRIERTHNVTSKLQ